MTHSDGPLPRYRRIVLKLSGEALAGPAGYGIDPTSSTIRPEIKEVVDSACSWRSWSAAATSGAARPPAPRAWTAPPPTTWACWPRSSTPWPCRTPWSSIGVHTRVQTPSTMDEVAEPYIRRRAIRHLEKGRVVIFAAGTGNPFFTTDTAAALRAAGDRRRRDAQGAPRWTASTTADPQAEPRRPQVRRHLTYMEALEQGLKVMDATAISLCMDNRSPDHRSSTSTCRRQHQAGRHGRERSAPLSGGRPVLKEVLARCRTMDEGGDRGLPPGVGRPAGRPRRHRHCSTKSVWTSTAPRCPINQVATVTVPEPRLIVVQPWDRVILADIERAIIKANLGLTPPTTAR